MVSVKLETGLIYIILNVEISIIVSFITDNSTKLGNNCKMNPAMILFIYWRINIIQVMTFFKIVVCIGMLIEIVC